MKRFITLLAVLSLVSGGLTQAYAAPAVARSTRHSLCMNGIDGPADMANRVQKALAADPSGRKVKLADCRVTPVDLLATYQGSAQGPKSVNDLEAYFRTGWALESPDPGEKFWSSCKDDRGRVIARCFARTRHARSLRDPKRPERVWVKGDQRLFEDCGNTRVERDAPPPEEPCAEVMAHGVPGRDGYTYEMHIAIIGRKPVPVSDKCVALMKPGENEWSTTLLDECPRDCDFSGPARMRGLPVQEDFKISFVIEEAGFARLRLPSWIVTSGDEVVYCLVLRDPNGRVVRQTVASHITRGSWRQLTAYLGFKGKTRTPENWHNTMNTWLFTDGRTE